MLPERVTLAMSIKPDFAKAGRFEQWHSSEGLSVAVIIPTYNHARYLADAISSAIAQTRPADEIIVVDDGSTDNPATVVDRFPGVHFIQQENRGRSAARNAGLRTCTSSHVVFLDADDRLLPNAIEDGLSCAAEHPDALSSTVVIATSPSGKRVVKFSLLPDHRRFPTCTHASQSDSYASDYRLSA